MTDAPKDTSALTHLDVEGRPKMVDVSEKAGTTRWATAEGSIRMSESTLAKLIEGGGGGPVPGATSYSHRSMRGQRFVLLNGDGHRFTSSPRMNGFRAQTSSLPLSYS